MNAGGKTSPHFCAWDWKFALGFYEQNPMRTIGNHSNDTITTMIVAYAQHRRSSHSSSFCRLAPHTATKDSNASSLANIFYKHFLATSIGPFCAFGVQSYIVTTDQNGIPNEVFINRVTHAAAITSSYNFLYLHLIRTKPEKTFN